MGLLNWLWRWFSKSDRPSQATKTTGDRAAGQKRKRPYKKRSRPRLVPLARNAQASRRERAARSASERCSNRPYEFARPCVTGGWLDLSRDGDEQRQRQLAVPVFRTPAELAEWLEIPVVRLAWLVHRFDTGQMAADPGKAHYHFHWLKKRSGGHRLIESPKRSLKYVQHRILREILDRVPPHAAAHGFVAERSILTNATPHAGQRVIVKFDLENFYPAVGFSRVVGVFRSLGYSREAALWLARLTTSQLPPHTRIPDGERPQDIKPYFARHLPQGAPTSPALANLSAFSLDLRLSGLARTFGARYTRYADDLTFSGDERFRASLAVFIPLVESIVRDERFRTRRKKRRVLCDNQRQSVTGVVVNRHPNYPRREYDRLKATLVNCIRRGPSTQNHLRHPDFRASLRGSIAHVACLNPPRGEKLLALFEQIDWNR